MSRVPRWYWPAACLPGVVGVVVGALIFHQDAAGRVSMKLRGNGDRLGMVFSLYVALILLGYLLLVLCRPARTPSPKPAPGKD